MIDSSTIRPLLCWLVYFILLLYIAMPHGLETEYKPRPQPLYPTSTLEDVKKIYNGTDMEAVSAKAIWVVQTHSSLRHLSLWPLWPPGMVVVESFFYWLSPQIPIILAFILITNALWATIFTQALGMMHTQGRPIIFFIAFLLPLVLIFQYAFTDLTSINVIRSEALAIPTCVLGMGFLYSAAWRQQSMLAVAGGIMLAISAYLRAQTDLIMSALLLIFLLCVALRRFRFKGAPFWLAMLGVALLTYHACTIPYRVMHRMQWVATTTSNEWETIWSTPEMLKTNPDGQPRIIGGGIGGCIVDAERCAKIHSGNAQHSSQDYFRLTLRSFMHHPLKWLAYKLPFWWDTWRNSGTVEPVLEALLLPLLLLYALMKRRDDGYAMLAVCLCAGVTGTFAPFLFGHLEGRYMFQLRFLILHGAIIAAGWFPFSAYLVRSLYSCSQCIPTILNDAGSTRAP